VAAGLSSADAEGEEEMGESEWTEEELLLLLEGVDKYAEDWSQVAAHVGTKTAQQCVLHFIRLPIHETVMDEQRLHALHGTLGEALLHSSPALPVLQYYTAALAGGGGDGWVLQLWSFIEADAAPAGRTVPGRR